VDAEKSNLTYPLETAKRQKFDQYCERKILELENGDFLVSRKPLAITTEPGWDKIKFYKETRKSPDGTIYVRKIKLMMSIGGLSDFEVIIEE
jgi:hypothetical protein